MIYDEPIARLTPHWSDDPRWESEAEYNAFHIDGIKPEWMTPKQIPNDRDGIDYHAAGVTRDPNGVRIL